MKPFFMPVLELGFDSESYLVLILDLVLVCFPFQFWIRYWNRI
jgi:hypothetical protein